MVGGQSAKKLEPAVWRYTLGEDLKPISNAQHFFTTKLPAGDYQVQMNGILSDDTTSDTYVCATGDKTKLVNGNVTGLYAYALGQFNTTAVILDSAYTVKIAKGRIVLFGCNFGGNTGSVMVARALRSRSDRSP